MLWHFRWKAVSNTATCGTPSEYADKLYACYIVYEEEPAQHILPVSSLLHHHDNGTEEFSAMNHAVTHSSNFAKRFYYAHSSGENFNKSSNCIFMGGHFNFFNNRSTVMGTVFDKDPQCLCDRISLGHNLIVHSKADI